MKKLSTKQLVLSGLIAALYVVLTLGLANLAYGEIQFRISEALVLLAFFNPIFIPAVTVGTFIANFVGPFGLIDAVLGSLASLVAMVMIWQTRKLLGDRLISLVVASLWPVVVNAVYVAGLIVMIDPDTPWAAFSAIALSVAIGEFVVVSLAGVALFTALKGNQQFKDLLK